MANGSRERLLAGAKQLFLARGYAGTTVDAICEKAELTKGSFYHFFDSKEELALAVLDWSLQRGGQVLARGGPNQIADPVQWRGRLPSSSIWRSALQSFGVADAC